MAVPACPLLLGLLQPYWGHHCAAEEAAGQATGGKVVGAAELPPAECPTAAALQAADSLAELDSYLKREALPAASVLRDESAEMRRHLSSLSSLSIVP